MIYNRLKFLSILLISTNLIWAGNEDRAGSAGATELLINSLLYTYDAADE